MWTILELFLQTLRHSEMSNVSFIIIILPSFKNVPTQQYSSKLDLAFSFIAAILSFDSVW